MAAEEGKGIDRGADPLTGGAIGRLPLWKPGGEHAGRGALSCYRSWMMPGRWAALLICLAGPVEAQAPYVPDVTEAREKEWRKLTASAQAAYASGRTAEGADSARAALALAEELFGKDDPRALISANDLALQLEAAGRYREAEDLLHRVFDSYLRTRGEDDPNSQLALENLVDFYLARKRHDAARPLAEYALASFRRTTGANSERSRRMEALLAQMPAAGAAEGSE